jgi:hypothetical protein
MRARDHLRFSGVRTEPSVPSRRRGELAIDWSVLVLVWKLGCLYIIRALPFPSTHQFIPLIFRLINARYMCIFDVSGHETMLFGYHKVPSTMCRVSLYLVGLYATDIQQARIHASALIYSQLSVEYFNGKAVGAAIAAFLRSQPEN